MNEAPNQIESLVKLTVDQMHEGIQIVDREWRYLYLNSAAASHGRRGREELVGRTMMECYPGIETTDMFRLLRKVMMSRDGTRFENKFEYPDGSHAWYALYLEPHALGLLIRSIDITANKKMEEQFLHAQRMEAIGRLAGGIAHDFNNKMGIVQIYADLALARVSQGDETLGRYLQNISKAVAGANKVTRQLLAFSRKQVLDLRVTNLNDVVSSVSGGLLALLGAEFRLEVELEPGLGSTKVDPSQIDQIIMNLVLNARDAMKAGGVVTIETANVDLDESFCASRPDLDPGPHVMLSVSDTGGGIPPELKEKIFDPFFTTKEAGRGTGLGLSSVFGIVKQSRGYIWVYSELGIGTTFKIYFPRVDEVPQAAFDEGPSLDDEVHGSETVLLVEDDEMLREAIERSLVSAGYAVTVARDAETAKEAFMRLQGRVDLLLTDVVLGSTSGRSLATDLKSVNAKIKVAFMSGYTENSIVHHGILDDGAILIQKPLSIRRLRATVRKVLDGRLKRGVV